MGGYCLFFGSAMVGYYGSAFGRLVYKGYEKNKRDEADRLRWEAERKLRRAGRRQSFAGSKDDADNAFASLGLLFLAWAALKSIIDK